MRELLAALVAAKSLSGNEGPAAEVVATAAADAGFDVKRSGNNVWFEFGNGGPRLLLHSHIDTVTPCGGWTSDPWTPVIAGDRLIGIGANDAKGCVCAMLSACILLAGRIEHVSGTVVAAFTAEEETGGQDGILSVLPLLGAFDAAVFGEPTDLAPCNAQGGMLLLKCRAGGDAGHVANAQALALQNAIHTAAGDINRLAALSFPAYEGGHAASVQVTTISGGVSANQVPDLCEFQVDLRTTPNLDHAVLLEQIRALIQSDVECASQRYKPVSTDADHPIVKAAVRASRRAPFYSPTVSDWSLAGGIPAVKFGPGSSARSHTPNEYILLDELAEGAVVYESLVKAYFREYNDVR